MFLSYPSGNIAIIVVPSNKKEAICIVQEDKDHNADILAIFGSSGKATCYHPNGMVWYVFQCYISFIFNERRMYKRTKTCSQKSMHR